VSLSVIDPKDLYSGNEPIPDKKWIELGKTEIIVPGKSTGKFPIYINIPDSYEKNGVPTSNYNKSYETWLFASQTAGAGNIRVDYNCRWTIQTPVRYVPPHERQGYINPMNLFYVIGIFLVLVITTVMVLYRNKLFKKKKTPSKAKHKSKHVSDSEEDIFG
jgi:hypothetical protein